ncbi:hypothetical protein V9K67_15425 [Paraflavisolibacter sp. H34]|uniref:hypothetical protein n=1 Tax=Huijunlia imazamoxiresistens TaxID=3127457 RepID=UPI00301A6169
MKPFPLLALGLLLSLLCQAQDTKRSLRNFTPIFTIDTFEARGAASMMKRTVIRVLGQQGIKSAYWDEDSALVTVQYNPKIVALSAIKTWFGASARLSGNSGSGSKTADTASGNTAFTCCCSASFSVGN